MSCPTGPLYEHLKDTFGEATARIIHFKYNGEIPSYYEGIKKDVFVRENLRENLDSELKDNGFKLDQPVFQTYDDAMQYIDKIRKATGYDLNLSARARAEGRWGKDQKYLVHLDNISDQTVKEIQFKKLVDDARNQEKLYGDTVPYSKHDANSNVHVNSEHAAKHLDNIANELSSRFNIPVKSVSSQEAMDLINKERSQRGRPLLTDISQVPKGFFSGSSAYVNRDTATPDTPFHEIAHPYVTGIRVNNPEVFESLKKQLISTEEGKKIFDKVQRNYPNLFIEAYGQNYDKVGSATDGAWEEMIVQAIGVHANDAHQAENRYQSNDEAIDKNTIKDYAINHPERLRDLIKSGVVIDKYKRDPDVIEQPKTLSSKFKAFVKTIRDWISNTFFNNSIVPFKLDNNTTLEQISDYIANSKEPIILESPEFYNRVYDKMDKDLRVKRVDAGLDWMNDKTITGLNHLRNETISDFRNALHGIIEENKKELADYIKKRIEESPIIVGGEKILTRQEAFEEYVKNYMNTKYKVPRRAFTSKKEIEKFEQENQFSVQHAVNEFTALGASQIGITVGSSYEPYTGRPIITMGDQDRSNLVDAFKRHAKPLNLRLGYENHLKNKGETAISLKQPFSTLKETKDKNGKIDYQTNISGLSANEHSVLDKFRQDLIRNYPNVKSLPASKVASEYRDWINENYGLYTVHAGGYESTYSQWFGSRIINLDYTRDNGIKYYPTENDFHRTLFTDDSLHDGGHNFKLEDTQSNINGLGWYIRGKIGNDHVYFEHQSDVLPEIQKDWKQGKFNPITITREATRGEDGRLKIIETTEGNNGIQTKEKNVADVNNADHFIGAKSYGKVMQNMHFAADGPISNYFGAYVQDRNFEPTEFDPNRPETIEQQELDHINTEYDVEIGKTKERMGKYQFTVPKIMRSILNIHLNGTKEKRAELQKFVDKIVNNIPGRRVGLTKAQIEAENLRLLQNGWTAEEVVEHNVEQARLVADNEPNLDYDPDELPFQKNDASFRVSGEKIRELIEENPEELPDFIKRVLENRKKSTSNSKLIKDSLAGLTPSVYNILKELVDTKTGQLKNQWIKKDRLPQVQKLTDLKAAVDKTFSSYRQSKAKLGLLEFKQKVYQNKANVEKALDFYRQQQDRYKEFFRNQYKAFDDKLGIALEQHGIVEGKKTVQSLPVSKHADRYEKYNQIYDNTWWKTIVNHMIQDAVAQGKQSFYVPNAESSTAIEGNGIASNLYRSPTEGGRKLSDLDRMLKYVEGNTPETSENIRPFINDREMTKLRELGHEATPTDVVLALQNSGESFNESGFYQLMKTDHYKEFEKNVKDNTSAGIMYLTLQKIKGIKLSEETPAWSKVPFTKVEIGSYSQDWIDRFQKVDQDELQERINERNQKDPSLDLSTKKSVQLAAVSIDKIDRFIRTEVKSEEAKGLSYFTGSMEHMIKDVSEDFAKIENVLRTGSVSLEEVSKKAFELQFKAQSFETYAEKRANFKAIWELNKYSNAFNPIIKEFSKLFATLPNSNLYKQKLAELQAHQASIRNIYHDQAVEHYVNAIESMTSSQLVEVGEKHVTDRLKTIDKLVDWNKAELAKEITKGKEGKSYINSIRKLETEKERYTQQDASKLIFTRENLRKYINGDFGDASGFTAIWDALIHNDHPEVSALPTLIHNELNRSREEVQKLQNKLQPVVDKYVGAIKQSAEHSGSLNNSRKLYSPITHELEVTRYSYEPSKDTEGNEIGKQVEHKTVEPWLLQPYDPQYISHRSKLYANITEAEHKGNAQDILKANNALNEWLQENFEQPLDSRIYEARAILTEHNSIAKIARDKIFDEINVIRHSKAHGLEYTEEEIDRLAQLNRDRLQLASTMDIMGNKKTGDDEKIAKTLQKYNKAMYDLDVYESNPNSEDFDRALRMKKDKYGEGSPEFQQWYDKNTRRIPTQAWQDLRKQLSRQINLLQDKSSSNGLSEFWDKIRDLTRGFRDEDGSIIGGDLTAEAADKIKTYQQVIEDIKISTSGTGGTSKKDKYRRQTIYRDYPDDGTIEDKKAWYKALPEDNQLFLRDLAKKEKANAITHNTFSDELTQLFQELAQLQTRKTTDRYNDAAERVKEEIASKIKDEEGNAVTTDHPEVEDKFRETEWYKKNHFTELKYDPDGKNYYEQDAPLYIWTETVPSDPQDYNVVPSSLWSEVNIKEDFKNKNYKVDIQGQPVPKEGKYRNERYHALKNATDETSKTAFQTLQTLTEEYHKAQEKFPVSMRLGSALPKFADESLISKTMERGLIGSLHHVKNEIWDATHSNPRDEGFYRDTTQQDDETLRRFTLPTAMADLEGNEMMKIPMHGRSPIDMEHQSFDIPSSILKYTYAAHEYEVLQNTNLEAQSFSDVLKSNRASTMENDLTNEMLDREARKTGMIRNGISDVASGITSGVNNLLVKKKNETTRESALASYIQQRFFGRYTDSNLPDGVQKFFAKMAQIVGSTTLALNFPADATNYLDAKRELYLEAAGKKHFNLKNLSNADVIVNTHLVSFANDTWMFNELGKKEAGSEYRQDSFREGQKSIPGQLAIKFDVIQGHFDDELGNGISATFARKLFSESPLFFFRNLGEYSAQMKAFYALADNTFVQHENGTIAKLHEIWEKDKDGNLKVKEGYNWTDKDTDRITGTIREINRDLNGNYRKEDRALIERNFIGKYAMLMKRYFVPKWQNRFGDARASLESQTVRGEGYILGFYNALIGDVWKFKSKFEAIDNTGRSLVALPLVHLANMFIPYEHQLDYSKVYRNSTQQMMTPENMVHIRKTAADVTIIYALTAMSNILSNYAISHKGKILNNWFADLLFRSITLTIMKTENEATNFVFLPGVSFNDIERIRHQPFALINKPIDNLEGLMISSLGEGTYLSMLGMHKLGASGQAFNKAKSITYRYSHQTAYNRLAGEKAGDLKSKRYLLKLLGFTGGFDMERKIENFSKLQQGNGRTY